MKRKLCNVLLSFVLAAALLTGCGGNPDPSSGGAGSGEGSQDSGEASEGTESGEESQNPGEPSEGTESGEESKGAQDPSGSASDESGAGGETAREDIILKEAVQELLGCRVGCAATEGELNDEKVWELVTTHFNAITFGNELKPDAMVGYSVGRCPGTEEAELNGETIRVPKLDYSRAERMLDKIYDWNTANPDRQILVKGHVLVWHAQTPEWFFHVDYDKNKDYVDKETMNKRLEWYIRTMLTHFTGEDSKYKDLFYGWDVVNEACSDNPSRVYRTDSENPNESLSEDRHGSNSSWWHIYQSNEYIINAFIYANKYAPADLELYYNDYNECETTKTLHIVELLQAIKDREGEPGVGTRLTAMGMQGHYSVDSPTYDRVEWAIKQYAEVTGNVQFSEMDMKASADYDGSAEAKEKEYKKQYGRYKLLYHAMRMANKEEGVNVTGLTFWGTADHYSWLQNSSNVGGGSTGNLPQCPLLFDENYQIKPSFYSFTEIIE